MKIISKLSLLALALTLASCNEKVSPELQSGNNSSTDPGAIPIPPEEYYFSVVSSSDPRQNFKLHKTGLGNAATNCEVRNTVGLSNDAFRANPTANDITCYFEAEELALTNGGLAVKIQASKNSCDYVGYAPYSYYNRIPGDSSGSYLQIECSGDAGAPEVASQAGARGIDISTSTSAMNCGDYASTDPSIPVGNRRPFQVETDQDLCAFNYKDGDEEQCDIGVITINKLTVSYSAGSPETSTLSTRTVRCGGKPYNCVKGPIREMTERSTSAYEVTQTTVNADFEKEYKYPGIEGTTYSNIHYANFRRNLASLNIDYVASSDFSYTSYWADPIFGKTFDPRVADFYAANKMLDGTTRIVSLAESDAQRVKTNTMTTRALAADPFLGIGSLIATSEQTQVNPFYTFYCFDTAFDMKARIRMVVRDWDRIFPTNSDLEYVSDIFRGASARQDNPSEVEIPGDIDGFNTFNDLTDWDDDIPMARTPGSFDPFSTIWRPEQPNVAFPNGWFYPGYFPNFTENDDH
ncbi:hypothetical protein ACJVC5_14390 [Peredibacter sp. HCB2-198]|uniref:hypothetical protein n=1 Tax=Peredibacter sp. HCB2-198 TaxID=3383025 RepID=UPI0038B69C5B